MGAGGNGQVQPDNWRTNSDQCCGMTIESLSHDIDLMRWILSDEAATVTAHVHSTVDDLPNFDNNAQVLVKMKKGTSAVINASWSSRRCKFARCTGSERDSFCGRDGLGQ